MAEADIFFSKAQVVSASAFATNALALPAARKLFSGNSRRCRLIVEVIALNGITTTIGVKLTAGDTSATNNSAGDVLLDVNLPTLTAAKAGTTYEYIVNAQPTARQYYGVYYTKGGATSATLNCYIGECSESNLTL